MNWPNYCWAWLALVVIGTGCGPTTHTQLTRCQNDKKTLLTRIVDEQKRVETLSAQNDQLTARLADSEKQLARMYMQSTGRYAAGPTPNGSLGSGSASSSIAPGVPPTTNLDRSNRLIPLGSPSAGSQTAAPPARSSGSSSARFRRDLEAPESSTGLPSLDAPSNGRSESGWLRRGPGGTR